MIALLLHRKLLDIDTEQVNPHFLQTRTKLSMTVQNLVEFINGENWFNALQVSYAKRIGAVVFLVILAFIVNTMAGRISERLKWLLIEWLGDQEEHQDHAVFVVDMTFEFLNITVTAILAWVVFEISRETLDFEGR
ncbi:predicted protein [Nematostella vectensis]|uniref:Uncharacterized protein n=1 Tax=Nematostella vectensis TaxID=45351 RepID=A7S890_NEMVE|nr:predicted protein [Nematostella vectensis]|eukprot:XP_001632127.1 predicted protein [Nematostella vectensis]